MGVDSSIRRGVMHGEDFCPNFTQTFLENVGKRSYNDGNLQLFSGPSFKKADPPIQRWFLSSRVIIIIMLSVKNSQLHILSVVVNQFYRWF